MIRPPLRRIDRLPGRRLIGAAVAGALAASGALASAPSRTCDFALSGWLGAQAELEEAQVAYLECREARKSRCRAARGRVRMLEQRVKLLRNYVDRHCRR